VNSQSKFAPVMVRAEKGEDSGFILANALPLPDISGTMIDRLDLWARLRGDKTFLSEPTPDGRRSITYAEAASQSRDIAARLLAFGRAHGLSSEHPVMIVAGNGIAHALVMLATMRIGWPSSVVSPTYCASGAAPWGKFADLLDGALPGLIVADSPAQIATVLSALERDVPVRALRDLRWLDDVAPVPDAELAAIQAGIGIDSIAKLLFTSGSTSRPKPVINTHRMMISNMLGLEVVWPFLTSTPPVMVDWLPWNHTFGGNCCFNLNLFFGGTLHIDDGKPLPGHIDRTIGAIRDLRPNVYFNVPSGYEALIRQLEHEPDLARQFFDNLEFLFNAGAPMPDTTRQRLERLAMNTAGNVPPIFGGWGSTETAPFSTVIYFPNTHSGNLGLPMPGTQIRFVVHGDRYELRVRGPNVMPAYWHQSEATIAAFDEDGFYRIGDAGKLIDPERPELGILFDGRIAENFKLSSGTWVNVGALRLAVVSACEGLVADAVIAGEGRDDLGLLLFLDEAAVNGQDAAHIAARLRKLLGAYNAAQIGSSTRIARFSIQTRPLSADDGEITDKHYINQRTVLARRSNIVEEMYGRPGNI
jgi:feruloyl-CoA synthase